MGCTCKHTGQCGLCRATREIKTAPDYCSCGGCDRCDSLADQVYALQHPVIRFCHGCGQDENHSHATSCATCHARYVRMMPYYMGKDVTLFSEDAKLIIYGTLRYYAADNYGHLPAYLRPLCVDKPGYAHVQFKPDQIVNAHTYNQRTKYGNIEHAVQITIKL